MTSWDWLTWTYPSYATAIVARMVETDNVPFLKLVMRTSK